MMYQEIGKRPTIYHLYADRLINEKVLTEPQVQEMWNQNFSKINEAYAESLKSTFDIKKWRSPTFHTVVDYTKLGEVKNTGISEE